MAIRITTSTGLDKFLNSKVDLVEYTKALDKNIAKNTPVKTGKLRSNRTVSIGTNSSTISINQPYASYVEEGTRPHIIVPKNKKALMWENGIFAKRVKHPGFTGRKFVQRSIDETNINIITDAIE